MTRLILLVSLSLLRPFVDEAVAFAFKAGERHGSDAVDVDLEAELQAQGIDVMASMFEREPSGFTEEFVEGTEPGEIPEEPAAEAPAEAESGEGEEA